jgi:hypothetical protein
MEFMKKKIIAIEEYYIDLNYYQHNRNTIM